MDGEWENVEKCVDDGTVGAGRAQIGEDLLLKDELLPDDFGTYGAIGADGVM